MTDTTSAYEKLGAFYLGRLYDAAADTPAPEPYLYDAKDLTTHAVCVGMTGSGKTGLCISLLEEAAIDSIPAIAIDPKGDLGNLLLNFPKLRAADFRPWIDEAEAARKSQSVDEYAAATAKKWAEGLKSWDQEPARIAQLRDAVDMTIYTPGSSAGLPLAVLKSLAAPPAALRDDADAMRDRIASAVSGLLGLAGIDADPIQSREHILLSTLFQRAWEEDRDLDLATLVSQVLAPPVQRVGVMDLETFFPEKDRTALSLRLNNLLASPGFAAWLEGEPLDVQRLLWTPEGHPRISILSIAHLSDAERMFFVTLLLNEVIAWMRSQSGTSSLRALLYMDEVFGFFPPTANPPSKTPMLTLLKQARAFGLGVVLATQNPVDLDYKGLSNAGTWFLGRLQTERDKARVLEGLEGASASAGKGFDRPAMDKQLAGLKSRVFVVNNVHEDAPVLMHTRWALSYLRGPLTRAQIQDLMADRKSAQAAASPAPAPTAAPSRTAAPAASAGPRVALPAGVSEVFLPPSGDGSVTYRPALLGIADLHYVNAKADVDSWVTAAFLAPLDEQPRGNVWAEAERLAAVPELADEPVAGAQFAPVPPAAANAKRYKTWTGQLKTHVYKEAGLTLYACKALKLQSAPGESEGDFRVRASAAAREQRDEAVEKLRKRYATKVSRLEERIKKAQAKVGREEAQYRQAQTQTAISVGATVLGALFGRKLGSVGNVGRATTAARGVGRAAREKGDVARAEQDLEGLQAQLAELEAEVAEEVAELEGATSPDALEIDEVSLAPRKSDITVSRVALAWVP